jgi:hypothetical protein
MSFPAVSIEEVRGATGRIGKMSEKIGFAISRPLPSEHQQDRICRAVKKLHGENIYPSGIKVSVELGRKTKTLNGPENRARHASMKKLGIKLKKVGWADEEPETIW